MTLTGKMSFLAVAAFLASTSAALSTGTDDANQAVMAARNGQYDEAIRLFTSAINSDELNLKSRAQAFAYRGIAKATTSDYEGALLDLNYAVALDTDYNADAFAYRGYIKLVLGQPKDGAVDLAKSADLLIWPYNVLWLYLARLKGGVPDTGVRSLTNNAMTLDVNRGPDGSPGLSRWPGPVVKFMLGKATRDEVAAAAQEGDAQKLAERVCDVDFYLAEVDLAHNDVAAAKPKLQRAAEKCPFASFERMGASAELMRLK